MPNLRNEKIRSINFKIINLIIFININNYLQTDNLIPLHIFYIHIKFCD